MKTILLHIVIACTIWTRFYVRSQYAPRCYCDPLCLVFGNCCLEYILNPEAPCAGLDCCDCSCPSTNNGFTYCWCDELCQLRGDCCLQYVGCKDECASNPCLNDGTCIDNLGFYSCACPTGFTGQNCQINMNSCEATICLNDGTCVGDVGGSTCTCVDGYEGHLCERELDDCAASPCQNEDIDDCVASPCQNEGTCVDMVNDFRCVCPDDYTGATCQNQVISSCAGVTCQNGGVCVESGGLFQCVCADGFTGTFCEQEPLTGEWAVWGDLSECSVTCGEGTRVRVRECHVVNTCTEGEAFELYPCIQPCIPLPTTAQEVAIAVLGSPVDAVTDDMGTIQDWASHSLNEYCAQNTRTCCQEMIGLSMSVNDGTFALFEEDNIQLGAPVQNNGDTEIAISAQLDGNALYTECTGAPWMGDNALPLVNVPESIMEDAFRRTEPELETMLARSIALVDDDDSSSSEEGSDAIEPIVIGVVVGSIGLIGIASLAMWLIVRNSRDKEGPYGYSPSEKSVYVVNETVYRQPPYKFWRPPPAYF